MNERLSIASGGPPQVWTLQAWTLDEGWRNVGTLRTGDASLQFSYQAPLGCWACRLTTRGRRVLTRVWCGVRRALGRR